MGDICMMGKLMEMFGCAIEQPQATFPRRYGTVSHGKKYSRVAEMSTGTSIRNGLNQINKPHRVFPTIRQILRAPLKISKANRARKSRISFIHPRERCKTSPAPPSPGERSPPHRLSSIPYYNIESLTPPLFSFLLRHI